uniref:Down syndrome cell adhesion molecule-like protein Dscam2 n=1 Tax=Strigamia maritima TaxID=126957 RepID=T1III8_STRMM
MTSFQCQTYNRLSKETVKSSTSGKLFVTEPQGNVPPKVLMSLKKVSVNLGGQAFLPCEVQAHPSAEIKWQKVGNKEFFQRELSRRHIQVSGSLIITDVGQYDYGTYRCTSINSVGQEYINTELIVTEPLSVTFDYKEIIADVGKSTSFSCKISGFPLQEVIWLKNGKIITFNKKIALSEDNVSVQFSDVSADDKGIYQCCAKNEIETVCEATVLILGDEPPRIIEKFESAVKTPGEIIKLKCSADGNPLPTISWFLDENILLSSDEITIKENIDELGRVVSDLTIDFIKTENGGLYKCVADNQKGKDFHWSRINVHGPVGVRSQLSLSVVNGDTAILNCPIYGYPIIEVRWEKDGTLLPNDFRQIQSANDSLIIHNILRTRDRGIYNCFVEGSDGTSLQGNIQLNVLVAPKLSPFSFQDELVQEGSRGRLQCVVLEGDTPLKIEWQKDDKSLPSELGILVRDIDEFSSILIVSTITPRHNGKYTCRATNAAGTAIFSTYLAVNVPPKILPFAFQDDQFFKGMRAQIVCVVSQGDLPIRFKWLKDDKEISPIQMGISTREYDDHANSLNIESVSSAHTGNYTCIASNKAASVSHTAQLLVYAVIAVVKMCLKFPLCLSYTIAPKITPFSFPENGLTEGVLARVSCVVYQGDLPIVINWLRNGKILSSNENIITKSIDDYSSILTIENVQRHHAGNYTCIARNSAAPISHTTELLVNVPPKIVPFSFQDDHLIAGSLLRVSCVVSRGDLPLSITWLKDDVALPETVSVKKVDFYSIVLSIDPVKREHTGNYTCKAQNQAGTATYSAELIVQVPPKWILEPDSQTIKNGNDAYFHCRAEGYPNPTITWMFTKDTKSIRHKLYANAQTVMLINGTLIIKDVSKEKEGRYMCIASNGVGLSLSTTVFLPVLAPPSFDRKEVKLNAQVGEKRELICAAKGDTPININWFYNNEMIKPSTNRFKIIDENQNSNSTLIIEEVTRKDSNKFECRANNSLGTDSMNFIINVQEQPEAPVLDLNPSGGNRSIFLSWSKSFDGNSPITHYMVQYKRQVDSWQLTKYNETVDGSRTAIKINNLQPATSYTFRVAAVNTIGISKFSAEITETTDADVPTGTVQNIDVEAIDGNTLRITWKAPRKETWNGAIRGYNIGYRVDGSNEPYEFSALEVPEDYNEDLIYQIAKLRKYTMYTVVIQAYNDKGVGPLSEQTVVMTSEDVPSIPPEGLRCSALSSKSIYVLWDPLPTDSVNGILRGYKVLYKPITEWYDSQVQFKNSEKDRITLQNLDVNTNYSVTVLAFTRVGDGVKTNPVYCKTHEDVPDRPTEIKVLPSSSDSVVVAWKPPLRINGEQIKYNVYYRPLSESEEMGNEAPLKTEQINTNNVHSYQSDMEYFEVKGLRKNQKYAFWVSATSAIGEGQHSDVIAQNVAESVGRKN